MVSDCLEIVFWAIDRVFGLTLLLSEYFDIFSITIGFFTAFTLYRFVVRPLTGGGFVDPSGVLRVFKGADSDPARKPEKK